MSKRKMTVLLTQSKYDFISCSSFCKYSNGIIVYDKTNNFFQGK